MIPPITFLNLGALLGFVAIAAPIIIHLLNKRRFKRVQWGAMQFLRASMMRVSRRLRMENLLLLLLRILIISVLVLAFARPAITTNFTSSLGVLGVGRPKTAMVLLIDTSLSMSYARDDKTNLERAKEVAKELVDSLKKGDTISVYSLSDDTTPLFDGPIQEFQRAKESIDNVKQGFKRANYLHGFDVTIKHLQDKKRVKNPIKIVFLLTDMQQTGWSPDSADDWKVMTEPLNNTSIFPTKPQFHVVDVSGDERENAAVINATYSPRVIGTEREVRINTQVMNFGKEGRDTNIIPSVDDTPKANLGQRVRLDPGTAPTHFFYTKFDTPGGHVVTAEIGVDSMELDNKRYVALDVLKSLPVLLINGAPSMQRFRGETDFLEVALSPKLAMALGGEASALARTTTIEGKDFGGEDLSKYHVVILANVDNLAPDDLENLEKFVKNGGGLLIFPGDLTDPQFYNGSLFKGGRGLLPTSLGEIKGDEREADPMKFARIAAGPYNHQSLLALSDPSHANLALGQIKKWFQLNEPADPTAKVIVKLDTGTPFLVEKPYERGRVILCATRCSMQDANATWADLPIRRFYVPLMHELVYYLASGNRQDRNVTVGTPLTQSIRSEGLRPDTGVVRLPNKETKPLPFRQEGDSWVATFGDTNAPGIYEIEVKDGEEVLTFPFAVNMSTEESDLSAFDPDKQKIVQGFLPFDVNTNWRDVATAFTEGRFGIEIWRWLAYLLLVFLFIELLMTSRRSKKQEVQQIEVPDAVMHR